MISFKLTKPLNQFNQALFVPCQWSWTFQSSWSICTRKCETVCRCL